jgi:hypothetical protein
MSDYLSQLRSDLVDAHERYGRRGRAGRAARPVHPRTWRPAPVLAGLAAAACLVAAVIAIRGALPGPAPAGLRQVDKVRVGGQPTDAAFGFGYLWVADFQGLVIQVDPGLHRVVRRVPLPGDADSIAVGAGAVWVTVDERQGERPDVAGLVRIDPRTGRTRLSSLGTSSSAKVAADRGAIWVMSTDQHAWLKRIDPATGRAIAVRIQTPAAEIAIGGESLWTLSDVGVLVQHDPISGRPLRRLPGLATRSPTSGERVLAADAGGVWVLQPRGVVRVTGGSVLRRQPLVRIGTIPLLGAHGRALWLAGPSPFGPRARYRVFRFDRDTGALTGTLDVGFGAPRAFAPSPDGMWVVTGDGTALLVR